MNTAAEVVQEGRQSSPSSLKALVTSRQGNNPTGRPAADIDPAEPGVFRYSEGVHDRDPSHHGEGCRVEDLNLVVMGRRDIQIAVCAAYPDGATIVGVANYRPIRQGDAAGERTEHEQCVRVPVVGGIKRNHGVHPVRDRIGLDEERNAVQSLVLHQDCRDATDVEDLQV